MKVLFRFYVCLSFFIIIPLSASLAYGQEGLPKEFIPKDATVSFVEATPFNVALKALNEISTRLERKVIVDPKQRTTGIGVGIENLPWRNALELIATFNGATLIDTETYILIADVSSAVQPLSQGALTAQQIVEQRPVDKDLREVTISATFFEADRKTLREIGVNWGIFTEQEKYNTVINAEQNVVGARVPEDVGVLEAVYSKGSMDINTLVKALSTSDAGKIIANPRISVADGRTGRVQIGQDFSIKQRDFAGNVIDVFVSAGIILSVTPQIIDEDSVQYIFLKVEAERSSATPGVLSTVVNKTNANTELLLNNGEKAGIGGLYSTEETKTHIGIPLLKSIPKWFFGLGYLFGFERVSYNEKELVIILKAEIVPTLEERLAGKERGDAEITMKNNK